MKSDIITIAMGELQVAFDNEVMKAVQKVGIDVDKEELLKALELHRSLVRCVECKWFNEKYGSCHAYHWDLNQGLEYAEVDADDFCSYGERKVSEIPTGSERSSE